MLTTETYKTASGKSFDVEIAAAPAGGKKYPVILLIHGNLGLADPFGRQLREFTQDIADQGYLAALPSYYATGKSDPQDSDIDGHVPSLAAAIEHFRNYPGADLDRLGLIGFSLGGGIAMSYMSSPGAKPVGVFADFYGYVSPLLGKGVAALPPTILFHNENDPIVPVRQNSEPLADALETAGIAHKPVRPYSWYQGAWKLGLGHAFKPGSQDDIDSRADTKDWLVKHLAPVGRP